MTEANNWELYSSDEEIERKENNKKINDHENAPKPESTLNHKESESLEKYMDLAGNALDVISI
jgi:hypothetical protein